MVAALHPIKIVTKRANYQSNVVDTTYDMFWLLSLSEMNIYNNTHISTVDGEPLQYYKELLESEDKVPNGTYEVLKKYGVNANSSSQYYWSRSAYLGYQGEWNVNTSGGVYNGYNPNNAYRLAVACAIV